MVSENQDVIVPAGLNRLSILSRPEQEIPLSARPIAGSCNI